MTRRRPVGTFRRVTIHHNVPEIVTVSIDTDQGCVATDYESFDPIIHRLQTTLDALVAVTVYDDDEQR